MLLMVVILSRCCTSTIGDGYMLCVYVFAVVTAVLGVYVDGIK